MPVSNLSARFSNWLSVPANIACQAASVRPYLCILIQRCLLKHAAAVSAVRCSVLYLTERPHPDMAAAIAEIRYLLEIIIDQSQTAEEPAKLLIGRD